MVKSIDDLIQNRKAKSNSKFSSDFINDDYSDFYTNEKYIKEYIDNIPNIVDGAKLLARHIRLRSKIIIAVDYDCDGLAAGAMLAGYLDLLGAIYLNTKIDYVVINGMRVKGNGLTEYLRNMILTECDDAPRGMLLLTADHGSSDDGCYGILKQIRPEMDIVVTDHHTIPETGSPTNCDVFVNPQTSESSISKSLSGCMVAFLLAVVNYKQFNKKATYNEIAFKILKDELIFAGLTTMSDVMSLANDLNRATVKQAINLLNTSDTHISRLWRILFNKLVDNKFTNSVLKVDYTFFNFTLAPVINTGSRTNNERVALDMLLNPNDNTNIEILLRLNNERKKAQILALNKALDTIDSNPPVICVLLEDIVFNINGIVAGILVDKFNKPVICFKRNTDSHMLYGSARSPGYSIITLFSTINTLDNELFITYGGHTKAGGCSLLAKDYTKLLDIVTKLDIPKLERDTSEVITVKSLEELYTLVEYSKKYEPYGENWSPITYKLNIKLEILYIAYKNADMDYLNAKAISSGADGNIIEIFKYIRCNSSYKNTEELRAKFNSNVTIIFNCRYDIYSNRYIYTNLKLED